MFGNHIVFGCFYSIFIYLTFFSAHRIIFELTLLV
ncbi:Uncharacterised protein [Streptococcus pneumoniae]|nr:Uncharacterised protein [Streptococcus pneumoniae]